MVYYIPAKKNVPLVKLGSNFAWIQPNENPIKDKKVYYEEVLKIHSNPRNKKFFKHDVGDTVKVILYSEYLDGKKIDVMIKGINESYVPISYYSQKESRHKEKLLDVSSIIEKK